MTTYEKMVIAGWSDMDFNSHMANTAYLDHAADVRMMYFAEYGFSEEWGHSPFARKKGQA